MNRQFALGFSIILAIGVLLTHISQAVAVQLQIPGIIFELCFTAFLAVGVMVAVSKWANS